MPYISSLFAAEMEKVTRSWGWFLVFGILLVILGIICIAEAQLATTFSILALGWILAISGVIWLVNTFRAYTWRGFFLYLLNALIRLATGYLLILHPDAGARGITMLLAVLFLVGGMFRVAGATLIQFPRWGWTGFSGLVSVVLGALLLISWPSASNYFIGLAIGIDLLFDGGSLIGFALAIHSLPATQPYEAPRAA